MTNDNEQILNEDSTQAMQQLIDITNDVIAFVENEANAIAMNDAIQFSMLEGSKTKQIQLYQRAAKEFHVRIEEFRGVDNALIEQLQNAQAKLGELTKNNQDFLSQIPGIKTGG